MKRLMFVFFVLLFCPNFSFLVVGMLHTHTEREKEGSDLVKYSLAMLFLMARPQSGKDMNMLLLT